jgi:hypothetical protein
MRKNQVEGVQGRRLAGDDHTRIARPIGLCLRAWRRLNATPSASRRWRIGLAYEALH